MEGIVVEERDEATGRPKPAVESPPLRPRQRHLEKQAEDTPFEFFVAENVQLVSCQKHWRSPTRLERRTEDVPRWLLLPLHEARILVDRGIVGCGEHNHRDLEHDSSTPEICVAALRSSLSISPMTFMVLTLSKPSMD